MLIIYSVDQQVKGHFGLVEYQFVFKSWLCWLKVSAQYNREVSLNLSSEL